MSCPSWPKDWRTPSGKVFPIYLATSSELDRAAKVRIQQEILSEPTPTFLEQILTYPITTTTPAADRWTVAEMMGLFLVGQERGLNFFFEFAEEHLLRHASFDERKAFFNSRAFARAMLSLDRWMEVCNPVGPEDWANVSLDEGCDGWDPFDPRHMDKWRASMVQLISTICKYDALGALLALFGIWYIHLVEDPVFRKTRDSEFLRNYVTTNQVLQHVRVDVCPKVHLAMTVYLLNSHQPALNSEHRRLLQEVDYEDRDGTRLYQKFSDMLLAEDFVVSPNSDWWWI